MDTNTELLGCRRFTQYAGPQGRYLTKLKERPPPCGTRAYDIIYTVHKASQTTILNGPGPKAHTTLYVLCCEKKFISTGSLEVLRTSGSPLLH